MIGTVKILPPELNGKTPPEGYGPLLHRPEGLETLAKGLLKEPMGVRAFFKDNGFTYLARLETHPAAPERGLPTPHKGVTVYEAKVIRNPWTIPFLVTTCGVLGYVIASLLK